MRPSLALAASFAASLLAACSGTGLGTTTGSVATDRSVALASTPLEATTLPAGADLSTPPGATLYFGPDWKQTLSDSLYGGATIQVEAGPSRFPRCGISGTVTVSARLDDGRVLQAVLDQRTTWWAAGALTIPTGTHAMDLWLRSERADGCVEYDSAFGKNYPFAVHTWAPTEVHFNADWSERADGPLVAGGALVVDYAMARLPTCRGVYQDLPTWDILAHLRFDTGEELTQTVLDWNAPGGVRRTAAPGLAVFPIPEGARHVSLWFENSEWTPGYPLPAGCPGWDSNYGKNYGYDVAPPAPKVGWAGNFDFVTFHRAPATELGDVDPAYYFDSYAGSELSTWVEAQVWIPGVTDRSYGSADAAAKAASSLIQARAVTDALAGEVGGWGTFPLRFVRQQGHDFVYAFDFWKLRYATYVDAPITTGLYHYYFRFSTDHGATWTSAGDDAGGARRFVVAPALDCTLFPDHAPPGCP